MLAPETAPQLTPEFPLGRRVPVKEHICDPGKLGQIGVVTRLDSLGKPLFINCVYCHKNVIIDLKTLRNQRGI